GTTISDSTAHAIHGIARNGVLRTGGPSLIANAPPSITLDSPSAGAEAPAAPTILTATIAGEAAELLTASFHGRQLARDAADFTIAVVPDTSNYTASVNGGTPATLNTMLDWIVSNRASRNIACVIQTGMVAPDNGAAAS